MAIQVMGVGDGKFKWVWAVLPCGFTEERQRRWGQRPRSHTDRACSYVAMRETPWW